MSTLLLLIIFAIAVEHPSITKPMQMALNKHFNARPFSNGVVLLANISAISALAHNANYLSSPLHRPQPHQLLQLQIRKRYRRLSTSSIVRHPCTNDEFRAHLNKKGDTCMRSIGYTEHESIQAKPFDGTEDCGDVSSFYVFIICQH